MNQSKKNILTLIDLLLLSYMQTESDYSPDEMWNVEDLLEDIKNRWGGKLRQLFRTWEREHEIDG